MNSIVPRFSRLILIGPPCSGKGTLAQALVHQFALPHISTGEIFRSHLNDNTKFGNEIKHCMQEGKLVPDELVTNITLKALKQNQEGYILDGFPRTLTQAEALTNEIGLMNVFLIYVEDEIVIDRLTGRITCDNCGEVFNSIFSPPKEEGFCDECQGGLIHRLDDTPKIAEQRLKEYHKFSEDVIDFYKKKNVVTTIETGNLKPDEIFNEFIKKAT